MLVNTINILNDARRNQYAVPQLNINNLEFTKYILEECETLKSPVILGVSEGAVKHMGGYKTVYNMVTGLMSDLKITIPVALHLDHGKNIESCKAAIDNGFTSVMIDASMYSVEDNIRITREVVQYAHSRNVSVEAEMGHVGGYEDGIVNNIAYANVEDCIKLTNEACIDSLAAAIGSVHGLYNGKAHINTDILRGIKNSVSRPLVLHGGTGINDEQIKDAIKEGISKVNINTELQTSWSGDVRKFLELNKEAYDPRKIISAGEQAIKNAVREKILLFNSNNRIQ